jgi:hypothetical protein
MRTRNFLLIAIVFAATISGLNSCKKDPPVTVNDQDYGHLTLKFAHKVNGQALIVDTVMYINAAGNHYSVQNIQYFLSDITLHQANGDNYTITEKNGIHYVDTDISGTQTWNVSDNIPAASYQSVSFTFGISQTKNLSNMYVNPPESDMFWPSFLGGGYHYMKLNGEWIDTTGSPRLYNFHLGIGQIYAGGVIIPDSITGFVQNYFTATLPSSSFTLDSAGHKEIQILMNIDSWFNTPHVWDFNDPVNFGWSIMQNQDAMNAAKENGADVFTIGYIQ